MCEREREREREREIERERIISDFVLFTTTVSMTNQSEVFSHNDVTMATKLFVKLLITSSPSMVLRTKTNLPPLTTIATITTS